MLLFLATYWPLGSEVNPSVETVFNWHTCGSIDPTSLTPSSAEPSTSVITVVRPTHLSEVTEAGRVAAFAVNELPSDGATIFHFTDFVDGIIFEIGRAHV